MANKPFEIQGSTFSIGGVELNSSTDGKVVIPGVTRATGFRVEEIEDTDFDQTITFTSVPVVIDSVTYNDYVNNGISTGRAEYIVELDDDNYIDDIAVNVTGAYSSIEANTNDSADMYAYTGSSVTPFSPFMSGDWSEVPFRPKMKATGVESEFGGGSGGAIVERNVEFPLGEDSDTRGTIALTPDGKTYVCVNDYEDNSSQYQGDYEAETSEAFNVGQTGGSFNVVTFLVSAEPELYYILQNDSGDNSAFQVDAGEAFGGPQTLSYYGYNETTMNFTWPHRSGVDPSDIAQGTSVTITYSGTLNQQPIWKRIVDLTSGGEGDGTINWTSEGDLTIETVRPDGYTSDCDINIDAADDVWIYAHGDEAQIRAQTTIELLSNTSHVRIITNDNVDSNWWTFAEDGSLKLPHHDNTGYQAGYSLNGPTLLLGGENDPNDQVIITGPKPDNNSASAQRLIIQGQKGWGGEDNNKGEGGDVYIWGGTGGDSGSLSSQGDGGDIKLRGGQGGQGGYVRIEGGAATATGNTGGFIDVNAGDGVTNGGDVHIRGGVGGTNNGEVNIYTASNQWIFKNDGALHLPGSVVKSTTAITGATLPTLTGPASILNNNSALSGLTDGTYGPFTLGVVTFSVVVFGGVLNGISNLSSTADVTVGDVLGTIDSGDLSGTAGTLVTFTVAYVVEETPTAIDLTKSINSIGDGYYTLADGVEGQIMYLVPNITTMTSPSNVFVTVNHARDIVAQYLDITLYPFSYYVGTEQAFSSICTLIYTQDHWQQIGGSWD